MASEDVFGNYSEEVISELPNDVEENQGTFEGTEDIAAEDIVEETPVTNAAADVVCGDQGDKTPKPVQTNEKETKIIQLPLTRIRNLMKLDPDLNIASHEAAFLVTRATELFIESLARESYRHTAQAKKKTIQKRDVDMAISAVDSLMFLEGAMNF